MSNSETVWDGDVPGIWYGCVVIELPNGETDYEYSYSSITEDEPSLDSLCPEGCTVLESTLLLTNTGKSYMYHMGHDWAFEAQYAPEGECAIESYNEYEDSLMV